MLTRRALRPANALWLTTVGAVFAYLGYVMVVDPTSGFGVVLGGVSLLAGVALIFGGLRTRIARVSGGGLVLHEPTSHRRVSPGASVTVDSGAHEVVFAKLWFPVILDHGERIELTSYASYAFLGGKSTAERRAEMLRRWLRESHEGGTIESEGGSVSQLD
jgi:hypothetical protein